MLIESDLRASKSVLLMECLEPTIALANPFEKLVRTTGQFVSYGVFAIEMQQDELACCPNAMALLLKSVHLLPRHYSLLCAALGA